MQAGEKKQCSGAWNSFRRLVNHCTPTSSYHSAINQMVQLASTLLIAYKYCATVLSHASHGYTMLWHTCGIDPKNDIAHCILAYRHQISGGHEGRCEKGSQTVSCNSWSSKSSGSQPQVCCNGTWSPQPSSTSLNSQSA